jgi:hypothetical protein
MSRLSRQCGILNISQSYRHARPYRHTFFLPCSPTTSQIFATLRTSWLILLMVHTETRKIFHNFHRLVMMLGFATWIVLEYIRITDLLSVHNKSANHHLSQFAICKTLHMQLISYHKNTQEEHTSLQKILAWKWLINQIMEISGNQSYRISQVMTTRNKWKTDFPYKCGFWAVTQCSP